jgi:hypothetical protein
MTDSKFPALPAHPPTQKQLDKLRQEKCILFKMGYAAHIPLEEKMRYAAQLNHYLEPYEGKNSPVRKR